MLRRCLFLLDARPADALLSSACLATATAQQQSFASAAHEQQQRSVSGAIAQRADRRREDVLAKETSSRHGVKLAVRDESNRSSWQASIAMQNAPQRVFELIGDPRSGVADDVTSNAFGEITVDMVHHQLSNEVYWYKYEFAGNAMRETHRDARLSEHAKNTMYILRAKDPNRWGISA